jgi:DNA invertase Pin-like site-specific DNA recombinase
MDRESAPRHCRDSQSLVEITRRHMGAARTRHRERTKAGLAHARENGKRLGRPPTATAHAAKIQKLYRPGVSKSEIARCLQAGRTSVRRILGAYSSRE